MGHPVSPPSNLSFMSVKPGVVNKARLTAPSKCWHGYAAAAAAAAGVNAECFKIILLQ